MKTGVEKQIANRSAFIERVKRNIGKWKRFFEENDLDGVYEQKVKNRKELKHSIKESRGNYIRERFVCSLCKRTHVSGYKYNINGEEYKVCKFCCDFRPKERKSIRPIYIAAGNKR